MKLTGLITEYNPFHNGHKYHLMQAKKMTQADAVVVVMSGNFVQRGTPAILDKWTRAEMAVQGGADLVIELPFLYATGSAELFALGALRILNGLNKIDSLVFGSEAGQIEPLKTVAHYLTKEPPAFKDALQAELAKGSAFPVARENALKSVLGSDRIPTLPNDILGIEYLKAAERLNSPMDLKTIKRLSSDYHDLDTDKALSSATAVRKAFFDGHLDDIRHTLPQSSYDLLKRDADLTVSPKALDQMMLYKLRTTDVQTLRSIHEVGEGLEFRIADAAQKAQTYEDLVDLVKSKRYVRTRIQRVLLNILFHVDSDLVQSVYSDHSAAYARVLAFNDIGRRAISHMRKDTEIPLITNINKFTADAPLHSALLDLDCRATDVYTLLRGDRAGALDKLKQPVYVR